MLKKISAGIFISLLLFLGSNAPIFAALDPLPLSNAPANQHDKYQTDLFTGTAAYSYPIAVPKGTNDLTPDVSLSYNSSAVKDANINTGVGWQLNHDYIERDVHFTPTDTSDDTFKLHFKGSSDDLVYVAGDNRYHTKIESFLNIQKITTGAQNDKGEYWQVITTDGTVYRFGFATNSELICNAQNYVTSWNLDQVQDTHNNHIYYTYTENNGLAYLNKITYNNDQQREIDFTYGTNSYQRQVYQQGCNVTDTSQLNNIQVKAATNLVRQYDLTYTQAGNTQPTLTTITQKGSDGSLLPATTFDYKPEVKSWNVTPETWINNADLDVNLTQTADVVADVNGDGLPDIVKSEGNGSNTWSVLLNQGGNSWSTQFQIWLNNQGIDAKLDRSDTRLIDVTGDGLPDIVKMHNDNSNLTYLVFRNTGTSWNPQPEYWVNSNHLAGADITTGSTIIADANGDGLPDIIHTWWNGKEQWEIFKNLGNSWKTSPETWSYNGIGQGTDDPSVRLIDVNGDGLADIVKTTYNGTNDTWQVWKNTGSSWSTTPETWINNANIDARLDQQDKSVTMADANGDGLVDIVKSDELGSADRWKVLLNKGNGWSTTWETWIDPSSSLDLSLQANTQMADVNGDGLPDVMKGFGTGQGARDTWQVWKNNGVSPDLLAAVHTPQGATISFDYTSSAKFNNKGSDNLPDLPFNVWAVQKMTVNNGLSNGQGTNDITTYNYQNGAYNWQNKEFRGFGEVDETTPNGNNTQNLFNQDDALQGTRSFSNTDNSSGSPYGRTTDTWGSTQSNGVYTVSLNQEKQYTYDGTSVNSKITETDYQYDNYGNVTKKSELGDTGTTGDERFTYNKYTYNPNIWLVNTLAETYINDYDDSTKIADTYNYYDNNLDLFAAPLKGDLTKQIKWLDGGTSPITQYTYDAYGNQTQVTDGNSHSTQTAYGTHDTTNTYPDSQTNAKNQQVSSTYDLGTGNLLSQTDPNGFATSYTYDVFGRIIAEIKPYDSTNYPTTSYQYFDNISAPQGTLISKRKISGAVGTLDAYMFTDGLGRKMQTRTDAEDPTKQIVSDTYYDATGQASKETVPHWDTKTTTYQTPVSGIGSTTTTYDPIGRVLTVTNPDNTSNTTSYDHWVTMHTDENGHQKKQYNNAFGKIIQVDEKNGSNTYTTSYTNDAQDNVTKIVDAANNNFTFTYDTLGRKISQSDPDMGTWTYHYDGAGNITQITDNKGITKNKTYDELNRLKKMQFPTDPDITYTYDGNNKIGTLTSVIDSVGTINYSYDNRLRKTQEQRVMEGSTWTTQYTYDAADRLVAQTNPDGQTVAYGFNQQGEISSVSGALTNIDYNAQNKMTQKTFANSLTTNYTYNTNNFRLNKIQTGTVQDLNYTYDNVGNVASIQNNLTNKTQTFAYDDLDRLLSASESAGYNYTYQYNPLGNLTTFTNAGAAITYTYGQNAGVHAVTSSSENAPTPTPTPPSNNPYTIYDEGLGSGWQDWSWSATNNLSDTTHPNTGTQDLSWTNTAAYGSVYLHNASGVDTTPYTNITFALRATQAGQQVQIQLRDTSDNTIGNPLLLTNYGGDPIAGSYKTYTIPLSALGGSNRTIKGITIQDITGTAQPVMYIDSVKLTGNTTPTPTPTATPTPTSTPTPTPTPPPSNGIVYDDTLASGWQDWSWSSTNNFTDTTYPYTGTKDISWTNTAAYGAFYLHTVNGLNTANYSALTFALRAANTGRTIQVQLYNSSGNPIGSPLQLTNYGGNPVVGSYKSYTIPLTDLGAANTTISGFIIQDTTGSAQQPMYIDSVSFTTSTAYIYDDSLTSGWQDWSWSSTNNFADTANPYAGTKDLSWITTAGYAGLYLHNASGLNTTGHNNLTFALKATQSGQTVQVQLYDSANNAIGSPTQLTNYGGNPSAGSYKLYTIPLSVLGGSNQVINGIAFQDTTGTTQPALFVDVLGIQ